MIGDIAQYGITAQWDERRAPSALGSRLDPESALEQTSQRLTQSREATADHRSIRFTDEK